MRTATWLSPFNLVFIGMTCLFGAGVFALTRFYGMPAYFISGHYLTTIYWATAIFSLAVIICRILRIMIFVRPRRLTRHIIDDLAIFFTLRRIYTALPVLVALPFFFSFFTTAKNMIPVINPFSWDPFFMKLDAWLFFGTQPWEILQPVLGFTIISLTISLFYKLWFVAKFSVIYWQAFSLQKPALREQFFIGLLLVWIINGVLLAALLSSAGPCYYGLIYPDLPDPYADLMAYLRAVPIYDLSAQDYLWDAYAGDHPVAFSGISAAPSMHVSLACLFALLGWRYGGAVRWGYIGFLIVTLIGSVHLGWHYLADGLISLITTPPLWWIGGRITRLWRKEK